MLSISIFNSTYTCIVVIDEHIVKFIDILNKIVFNLLHYRIILFIVSIGQCDLVQDNVLCKDSATLRNITGVVEYEFAVSHTDWWLEFNSICGCVLRFCHEVICTFEIVRNAFLNPYNFCINLIRKINVHSFSPFLCLIIRFLLLIGCLFHSVKCYREGSYVLKKHYPLG